MRSTTSAGSAARCKGDVMAISSSGSCGRRPGRRPFVAEHLRLGEGLHARVVDVDVLVVEEAGDALGEAGGAIADRRDVARHRAVTERRRKAEAVDAVEARTGARRLLVQLEGTAE